MELTEGLTVAGRYQLERRIGVGGMGEVWAATQTLTRKPVALKFLLPDAKAGDGTQQQADRRHRFLREARTACAVRHPNVVQIHDVLELEDGSPVMVMELLQGESLEERLQRDGRLALGDLTAVIARVVSAVGTAHALGIVHRDLKPENIFLAQTPDGVDVKVLDFGIAKLTATEGDAASTGGLTKTGAMLGTPYYMSPEQAFGEKLVDHRADIWSLGVILYRGLSGTLPTEGDNIGQILKIIMTNAIPPLLDIAPDLPPDLAALVMRMLQQEAGNRPQDLNEVRDVLAKYAGVEIEAFDAPARAAPTDDRGSVPGGVAAVTEAPAVTGASGASKSRAALVVGVLAVMAVGVGITFVTRTPHDASVAPPASAAAITALPSTVASTLPATPPAQSGVATLASIPSETAPLGSSAKIAAPRAAGSASRPITPAQAAPGDAKATSIGGVIVKAPF